MKKKSSKNPIPGSRTKDTDKKPGANHHAGGSRYGTSRQIRPSGLETLKPSQSDGSSFAPSKSSQTPGNAAAADRELQDASTGKPVPPKK